MMRAAGVLALVLAVAAPASAQVLLARPYEGSYRLGYGRDNDGGRSGSCDDYACRSTCYDGHSGHDFATPFGTEVRAAADGRVVDRHNGCANVGYYGNTCGGSCGNHVLLEHSDGSRTIYCHMRLDSLRVGMGDRVTCGQLLGQSASSGNSTGNHLHFGWNPGAGYREPFRGACGRSSSMWREQRGHAEAPGASCGCVPATETCNGADDDCDGAADEDDVCAVELLRREPAVYAPPTTSDVNGDGRADVCARGSAGLRCWIRGADGWALETAPIPWSDETGWDDVANYATIRMGDIDGDGLADACARANAGVVCALSIGDGFAAPSMWQAELSDENGWGVPRFYTTLRLADVDGDRRDDLCARSSAGFACWLSTGASFGTRVEGPGWADEHGWGEPRFYGTIRMADLDADGRSDVCARAAAGVECWLSSGTSLGARVEGPAWADEHGWDVRKFWSTIRLADIDGDGRQDLCARSATDLRCVRFDGVAFGETWSVAGLSDESGWGDEANYATIRVGDVNGDGADDLCARANAGVHCWVREGGAFVRIDGPTWSDDTGWGVPRHYETMRLADVDGDGRDDVCARAVAGYRCNLATGSSFDVVTTLDDLTNDGGWDAEKYWSTIVSGSASCRAATEACNGVDDDCDGEIDEGCPVEPPASAPDAGVPAGDAGMGPVGRAPSDRVVSGGCAVALGSERGGWIVGALVVVGMVVRRRRGRVE